MTAPVMRLYSVVETDADPCAIPSRPAHTEPDAAICYEKLKDRLWTYKVLIGDPEAPAHVGFLRWDDVTADWIARTRGSAFHAATIRKFRERNAAAQWLVDKNSGTRKDRVRSR